MAPQPRGARRGAGCPGEAPHGGAGGAAPFRCPPPRSPPGPAGPSAVGAWGEPRGRGLRALGSCRVPKEEEPPSKEGRDGAAFGRAQPGARRRLQFKMRALIGGRSCSRCAPVCLERSCFVQFSFLFPRIPAQAEVTTVGPGLFSE